MIEFPRAAGGNPENQGGNTMAQEENFEEQNLGGEGQQ